MIERMKSLTVSICKSYLLSCALILTSLYSCIPQSKLEYLQNPVTDNNFYTMHDREVITIKPNDELYIRVSSFDDISFNFFSTQTNASALSYGSEASISLISYSVSDSGYIDFPILGHIQVANLTVEEAASKLKSLLSEYFNQPTVLVKIVNKKITVIGEVNQPGSYSYTSDRITIFEALALAGSTNIHSDLKSVYLIRSIDNVIVKTKLDLTSDEILFGNHYYLQTDDVVYVKPRNSLKWEVISTPISVALSTITTALLILNYFR